MCADRSVFAFGTAFLISAIKRKAARASGTSDELPSDDTSDTLIEAARSSGISPAAAPTGAGKAAVFGAVAGITTASSAFVTFLLAASSQGSVIFPLVSVINLIGV